MKIGKIMDTSMKNDVPSMKTSKVMDGSITLKWTNHQNVFYCKSSSERYVSVVRKVLNLKSLA